MPRPLPRLLLALALVPVSCGPPVPPKDVNFILITFDTLRADRLGAYGNDEWGTSPSPNADALASRGVLFKTSYVPRGQTHPSIASMLTGKYPITHGLRSNGYPLAHDETTLFEHLQAAGYQTGVFASNLEIGVEEWAYRGADVKGDGYRGRMRQEAGQESRFQRIWDDRVEEDAQAFLDNVDTSRPFALWVHYYDVHKPYNPPSGFERKYGASDADPIELRRPGVDAGPMLEEYLAGITLTERPVEDQELRRIRGLYDAAVTATDQRVGRLLQKLRSLDEIDSSYIAFTSDHGEELFDHNRYFFHGSSIYDGVVQVPLIIAGPEVTAGAELETLTQNIDVLPTVLDLLGLPPADAVEGHSLVPALRGESTEPPAPYAFVEWQDLIYAVSDGQRKLIWNPEHTWTRKSPYNRAPPGAGFRIACVEGYDLRTDPLEQHNELADMDLATLDFPPEYKPLYKALRDWLADPSHQRSMSDRSLDASQVERLAALGYIAATRSVSGGRGDSTRKAPCVER